MVKSRRLLWCADFVCAVFTGSLLAFVLGAFVPITLSDVIGMAAGVCLFRYLRAGES